MEVTKEDNTFLKKFKGKVDTTEKDIRKEIDKSIYYTEASDKEKEAATTRIYEKLNIINSEYMKWFEFLLAFVFAIVGYMAPIWMLYFHLLE